MAKTNKQEMWIENYNEALEIAKKENKYILMDFTGSDWCVWCMKLEKEVFSKQEFIDYANEKLVMLKVDFPQTFDSLPIEVKQERVALQNKYGIQGYPTIIVLNNQGETVAQTGYQPGGAKNFIKQLDSILK